MPDDTTRLPLLRTKLHRPPVTEDFVPRPRLVERLEQGRGRPLTLVCAPAGYGKSTLLSGWLAASEVPGAWVSLDPRDDDLQTFLTYFVAAVREICPGALRRTGAMLDGAELPPQSNLARRLVNELDEIDAPLALVLDDYHVIHQQAVHDLLDELLAQPPRAVRLVIASRRDPPLSLATLRTRGACVELRAEQLRFDAGEAAEFLGRAAAAAELDGDAVRRVAERAEGWAAGLRLAALSLRGPEDVERLMRGVLESDRNVMDFLVSEVVARQPRWTQDYLLATSILDRFSAALCQAVVGSPESTDGSPTGAEFLAWAERANLFLVPLDEARTWFRFHRLFQRLLRHELEARMSGVEIAELHRRASGWFEQHRLIDEAVDHALHAGDVRLAAGIVRRCRHELMNREQWPLLHRLLARLPAEVVQQDLDLQVQAAWCAENRHRLRDLMAAVDRAQVLAAGKPGREIAHGELATLRAARAYYDADAVLAIDLLGGALELLPRDAHSVRGFAVAVRALALQASGEFAAATRLIHEELANESIHGTTFHGRLLIGLALAQWCRADLTGMRQTAQRLGKLSDDFALPQTGFFARYFEGVGQYHRNDLASAERSLASVVEGSYAVDRNTFVHGAFALAATYAAQRRFDDAMQVAESAVARSLESHNELLTKIAQAFQAELMLRQGRIGEAYLWAETFDPEPLLPALRFYVPQITLVKVLLAQVSDTARQRACEILDRLEQYFAHTHNTMFLVQVLALRALLHEEQGERPAALEKLECAVVAGSRGELVRVFLDLGPELMELAGRLELREDALQYAGRLQVAFHDDALGLEAAATQAPGLQTPPSGSQPLVDPLSDRELDVLSLLAERLSNKEIAARLHITPATVKRHTIGIYQKLNVHGRRDAASKARALGLIPHS